MIKNMIWFSLWRINGRVGYQFRALNLGWLNFKILYTTSTSDHSSVGCFMPTCCSVVRGLLRSGPAVVRSSRWLQGLRSGSPPGERPSLPVDECKDRCYFGWPEHPPRWIGRSLWLTAWAKLAGPAFSTCSQKPKPDKTSSLICLNSLKVISPAVRWHLQTIKAGFTDV